MKCIPVHVSSAHKNQCAKSLILYRRTSSKIKAQHGETDEKECINGAAEREREMENKRRETITDERMKLVKLH